MLRQVQRADNRRLRDPWSVVLAERHALAPDPRTSGVPLQRAPPKGRPPKARDARDATAGRPPDRVVAQFAALRAGAGQGLWQPGGGLGLVAYRVRARAPASTATYLSRPVTTSTGNLFGPSPLAPFGLP